MQLWHSPLSPPSGRIRFALDAKGFRYEPIDHIPGVTDWKLSRVAPEVMVPTLVDGKTVLQGSDAIMEHLESRRPAPNLLGEDDEERSAIRRYVDVFHELVPDLRTDVVVRIREELDSYSAEQAFGSVPAFIRVPAARIALDRFSRKWNCDEANVHQAQDRVINALRSIVAQLDAGRHLVGGRLTDADICMAELGLLFRPPTNRWVTAGPKTRVIYHADWFPTEITHPYEVWRDWLYTSVRSK